MDAASDEEEKRGADGREQTGEGEHGGIAEVRDEPAGAEVEEEAADAGGHTSESSDRADGGVGEEVAGQRLDVRDPHLEAEEDDGDHAEGEMSAEGDAR